MNRKESLLIVSVLGCVAAQAAVVASFNEGYDGVDGATGSGLVSANISWGDELSNAEHPSAACCRWGETHWQVRNRL